MVGTFMNTNKFARHPASEEDGMSVEALWDSCWLAQSFQWALILVGLRI